MTSPVIYALLAALPAVVYYLFIKPRSTDSATPATTSTLTAGTTSEKPQTIMQTERTDLEPPKDDPFTLEDLKAFDGSDPSKPIYVAIKGTVFDVSRKADVYGPGKSYNIFAGKDGSRGLGMSSLKTEDAVPDYTTLDEKDMGTLNEWHVFFTKRYNIVGKVVDLSQEVHLNGVNGHSANL